MRNSLPAIQQGFHALSNEQQIEHRRRIAARCEAILGQFWRDDDAAPIRALQVEGYVDVLQHVSHGELRDAWAEYQRTGPRTRAGRLLRPDAGALLELVVRDRARKQAPVIAPRPAPELTPREGFLDRKSAAEIMDEVGFRPRSFTWADDTDAGLLNQISAELDAGAAPAAVKEIWSAEIARVEARWPDEGAKIRAALSATREG